MKKNVFLGILLVLFVSGYTNSIAVPHTNTGVAKGSTSKVNISESERVCEPYKQLIVQIETIFADGTTESGSGFIVGESGNELYIVTANHVVSANEFVPPDKEENTNNPEIQIRFFGDQSRPKHAELLTSNSQLDVALLCVDKRAALGTRKIFWDGGLNWCRKWKPETPVWFIGWENQSWHPSPAPGKLLDRTIAQPAWIKVFISTIQPGNSGAPFITQDCGIVSMAIQDSMSSVLSVDIAQIKKFVTNTGYDAWNLREKGDWISSKSDHVKIVRTESSRELAQDIQEVLKKHNFQIDLIDYDDWANTVINDLPYELVLPSIDGNNLFFRHSYETEQLADQVGKIVKPFRLKKRPLFDEHRATSMMGADTILIVLNESPSMSSSFFLGRYTFHPDAKEGKAAWRFDVGMSCFHMNPHLPRDLIIHSTHPDDQSFMSGSPGSTNLDDIDMTFFNLEIGRAWPLLRQINKNISWGVSYVLKIPVSDDGRNGKQNENDTRPTADGSFIYSQLSDVSKQHEVGLKMIWWHAVIGNDFQYTITPGFYLGYWEMDFEKGWNRFGRDQAEWQSAAEGFSYSPQIALTVDNLNFNFRAFTAYRVIHLKYDYDFMDSSNATGVEFGASVGWKF